MKNEHYFLHSCLQLYCSKYFGDITWCSHGIIQLIEEACEAFLLLFQRFNFQRQHPTSHQFTIISIHNKYFHNSQPQHDKNITSIHQQLYYY